MRRQADLVAWQEAAGQPTPETMRRLMHAILAHQAGDLRGDATTMLVEWQGDGARRIVPWAIRRAAARWRRSPVSRRFLTAQA